jgi:uncharacterized protein YdcH (DUF465 family)
MPELTIETNLKDVLNRLDQRFDRLDQKLEKMDDRLCRMETGQARIEEKLDGLDKRVEKLEGSQNKQIWTLIGIVGTAIIGTLIRFLLVTFPPQT